MFVCQQCAATFDEAGFCAHDGTKLSPSTADPLIASMIGPYRVEALIGVGGMGQVYKAVHPDIGSRVAVKVLSQACASNPGLIARFFDEARAVNLIRHENIVNILDLAYLPDRRPYIVMEFLDGCPLADLITEGKPLPIGTVLHLFQEVLGALEAAHNQNIVHRDLKPDNIVVSPNGRPKVLDFGIAKLVDENAGQGQTQEGSILGTPHYMSPEQALSQPVDARADIYAIGVILYECVTGRKPFRAESLYELLEQHIRVNPPAPHLIRPTISKTLSDLIMRALYKDPNKRWQRANELAWALQQEQQGLPETEWVTLGLGQRGTGMPSAVRPPSLQASADTTNKRQSRGPIPTAAPPINPRKSRAPLWVAAAVAIGAAVGAAFYLSAESDDQEEADGTEELATISIDGSTASEPADASVLTIATGPDVDASLAAATPSQIPDAAPGDLPARDKHQTLSPKVFEVTGYLETALRRAKLAFPDAVLVRIDAEGVRPSGKADLSLSEDFDVTYRFKSPSQAKRPKDLPLGVAHKPTCLFYVVVGPRETHNYPLPGWECSEMPTLRTPKCSAKQIWERAIADKAPKTNAVAELGYRRSSGVTKWYFSIGSSFSKVYDDDC